MSYDNNKPSRLDALYRADLDRRTGQTAAERHAEIDRRIDDRLKELGREFTRAALGSKPL